MQIIKFSDFLSKNYKKEEEHFALGIAITIAVMIASVELGLKLAHIPMGFLNKLGV